MTVRPRGMRGPTRTLPGAANCVSSIRTSLSYRIHSVVPTRAMTITPAHRDILYRLVYIESWTCLLEETGMHAGALRSDLAALVSHGYVDVYEPDSDRSVSPFLDVDRMDAFRYKATKIGLDAIRNHVVED